MNEKNHQAPTTTTRLLQTVGLGLIVAIVLLACGGSIEFSIGGQSVEDAAVELIEGDLAEQLEQELTATCPTVEDPEVGTEFRCTATTASGRTIDFDGVVDREDHINVVAVFDVAGTATELIETELADILGVEFVANCPPVASTEVGTEFECTATTGAGETVNFAGVVDREDHINVVTTNVINGDALVTFETEAGRLLTEQLGVEVMVDCGEGTKVLDAEQEIDCEASDATDTRGAKLKVTNTETGEFTIRLV